MEAELTIDVIIPLAIRLSIAFASGTGCDPSPQQGSTLGFLNMKNSIHKPVCRTHIPSFCCDSISFVRRN